MSRGILNFVLIGAKSTGKTTYLSLLIKGESPLTPVGQETIEYLNEKCDYIKKHKKTEPTPAMHKVLRFKYDYADTEGSEFTIEDYDGKFAETVFEEDENTKNERDKLRKSIYNSEGCIFLLPYEDDPSRLKKFVDEIAEFIRFANFNTQDTPEKSPIPATIMITKWDDSEYFQSEYEEKKVLEYIDENETIYSAIQHIKNNFKHTQIIPVSSFKDYNILKPIEFSLKNTFDDWLTKAEKYKKEDEKKFFEFLEKIEYDTKSHPSFENFHKELKDNKKKQTRQYIKIASVILAIFIGLGLYFANLNANTTQKKWMNETKICLVDCKGEKGLKEIDRLIGQIHDSVKLVENNTTDKRLEELNNLKSQIHIKINKQDSAIKLKDCTTIQEVADMGEEAFVMKSVAIRHIASLYPDFFATQKGESILASLKNSTNQEEFEEILDEDVQLFIQRKEKHSKIISDIESASNPNDVVHIDYTGYAEFEDFDRSSIVDSLNKKIDIYIKEKLEEKPSNKMNTLAIDEWTSSINQLKVFEIPHINYIFKISNSDEKSIMQTQKESKNIANLLTHGINNISVKIIGHEENSIGFECSILGWSDAVAVSGLSQILSYDRASNCTNNSILFKNKITLKAIKYHITVMEYGIIPYFDERTLRSPILFTKEDLYRLSKSRIVTKSINRGRIELVFDKSFR